ncbi:MAG TPA: vitamin K epoxide reductase family protein [Chloroflexota bacterium]|nr:vitamin K epoxide reductase family protein [Chloroflexota bacterium]
MSVEPPSPRTDHSNHGAQRTPAQHEQHEQHEQGDSNTHGAHGAAATDGMRDHSDHGSQSGQSGHGSHGSHDMAGMGMDAEEPGAMMAMHHHMVPWVDLVSMGLGAWLVASPATLGYRSAGLTWSDIASGVLVIIFAALSLWGRKAWAPYAATLVGAWLLFAPLIFWAPDAAAYANDTLVGALVIAFAILIPHGMEMGGPQIPRGWTYNPSAWTQRAPLIVLGLLGFFLSRYMAAYQLGHIPTAWDPFFGEGTVQVLESEISKMFPVSDAGLGAAIYLLEVLMTVMGDARRWRTMPWMVAFFAVLVIPLGVTSIVLVMRQPLAVGTWCTLCLVAALAMLLMVPLMLDEVVAMAQIVVQRRREGASLWRTFWLGANQPEGQEARAARPTDSVSPAASVWGMTLPWTLVGSMLLGGWLLLAPAVLGTDGQSAVASSDRLAGSLVITWAMIALAEVARPVRFLNIPLGLWLVAAPWVLGGAPGIASGNDVAVGVLLVALSWPRGAVRECYGGWDRYVR